MMKDSKENEDIRLVEYTPIFKTEGRALATQKVSLDDYIGRMLTFQREGKALATMEADGIYEAARRAYISKEKGEPVQLYQDYTRRIPDCQTPIQTSLNIIAVWVIRQLSSGKTPNISNWLAFLTQKSTPVNFRLILRNL